MEGQGGEGEVHYDSLDSEPAEMVLFPRTPTRARKIDTSKFTLIHHGLYSPYCVRMKTVSWLLIILNSAFGHRTVLGYHVSYILVQGLEFRKSHFVPFFIILFLFCNTHHISLYFEFRAAPKSKMNYRLAHRSPLAVHLSSEHRYRHLRDSLLPMFHQQYLTIAHPYAAQ